LPAARRHRRPGTPPPLPATVFRRINEGPIIAALDCRAICYRWPKAYATIHTEAARELLESSSQASMLMRSTAPNQGVGNLRQLEEHT
jgi:hypothetical protein